MKKGKRTGFVVIGIILAIILSLFFLKTVLGIVGLCLIIYGLALRKEYKKNHILTTKPFWLTYSGIAFFLLLIALFIGQNHTFFNIVLILLIVITLLLFIGMIRPSIPLLFSKYKTRKHVLTVYGFTFLILFLTSGIVSPTNEVNGLANDTIESSDEQNNQAEVTTEPYIPEITIPATDKQTNDLNPDTPVSSDNMLSNQTGNNKIEPLPEPIPEPTPPQPSYPTDGPGPNGETIKGNINSKGEKIYHVPGGQLYDETEPEKWFFTEEEAIAAGYKPSKK